MISSAASTNIESARLRVLQRYGLKTLVYFEVFDDIQSAIQREKNIKHWSRTWKVRLTHQNNPQWLDLYDSLT